MDSTSEKEATLKAIRKLEETAKKNDSVEAYLKAAKMYCRIDEYKSAVDICRKIMRMDGLNIEARLLMGECYLVQGDHEPAYECLETIINENPDVVEVYYQVADIYYHTEQWVRLLGLYEKLLEKYPKECRALYDLGMLYLSRDKYDQAMDYFQRLQKEDTEYPLLHYGLGRVHYGFKEYEKALEEFKQQIQLEGNHTESFIGMGDVYDEQKHYEQSIRYYTKGLYGDVSVDWRLKLLIKIGNVSLKLKDLKSANASFQEVLSIDKKNVEALVSLARIAFELNQYEIASKYAIRALRLNKHLEFAHYLLACSYHMLGRYWKVNDEVKRLKQMKSERVEDVETFIQNNQVRQLFSEDKDYNYDAKTYKENQFDEYVDRVLNSVLYVLKDRYGKLPKLKDIRHLEKGIRGCLRDGYNTED